MVAVGSYCTDYMGYVLFFPFFVAPFSVAAKKCAPSVGLHVSAWTWRTRDPAYSSNPKLTPLVHAGSRVECHVEYLSAQTSMRGGGSL